MIIDRSTLVKFGVTLLVTAVAGYVVMYAIWVFPMSRQEPIDTEPAIEVMTQPINVSYELPDRDFFVEHRMERERERSERIELLREIVNNSNSSPDTIAAAQKDLMALATMREKEMQIESLITGKGFADTVVVIGNGFAEIIIKSESLSEAEALMAADVVRSVTGIELAGIKVRFRN